MNFLEALEELDNIQEGIDHAKSLHPIFSFENTCGICPGCGQPFPSSSSYLRHLNLCTPFNQDVKLRVATIAALTGEKEGVILKNISKENLLQYRDQAVVCEICGTEFKHHNKNIDHDHSTNYFRGILCNSCNSRLGWLENREQTIQEYRAKAENKIADYNKEHLQTNVLYVDLTKDSLEDALASVIQNPKILKNIEMARSKQATK